MDRRAGSLKRWAIASISAVLFLSGTAAVAGPEDEVRALLLRAENVFAAGISPTTIFVAWDDTSLLPETGWRIEMATAEEGPYVRVSEIGACVSAPSAGTDGMKPGKCVALVSPPTVPSDPTPRFYRVVPLFAPQNVSILEGAPSLPDPAILGPKRPTNLRCNGGLACLQVQSITLTWTDNSDESLFWIMRAKGIINPQFGTEPHAEVPANVTTYSEMLSDFNQTYHYKVTAVREANIPRLDGSVTLERSFSDSQSPDSIKVETPPVPAPADPTGLDAQFIPPSTVKLTWTDVATNEDGFFVEWGPNDTAFATQDVQDPKPGTGVVTWTDDQIPPDTSRCYQVRAWRLGPAYSGYSNVACLGSTPDAPTNLVADAVSNTRVDLTWRDNSSAESGYVVERCDGVCTHSGGSWMAIAETLPANTTSFADLTTVALRTYSYRVFAVNSSGRSRPSNIATTTTLKSPIAKPTDLVAEGIGAHKIQLTWMDNATTETGFRIEYQTGNGDWETLAHRGPRSGTGPTTYVDSDSLPANTQRCYRVRAVKSTVEVSDPSNEDCGRTFAPSPPNGTPTGVDAPAEGIHDRRVLLRWTDNASNEDSFRIEVIRFPNQHCSGQSIAGLPWKTLTTAPAYTGTGGTGPTSKVLTGLQPHTAHFFRVIAVNLDGESDPSSPSGCVQTLGPPIPTFVDPAEDGDVEVTRCSVKLTTPVMENGEVETNRMRLRVLPAIPGHGPYDVITLWLDKDNKLDDGPPGPEGDVPGAVYKDTSPSSPTFGMDIWEFEYQFRKSISYGLLAASEGPGPTVYLGDEARLSDVTVLADCPQSGL